MIRNSLAVQKDILTALCGQERVSYFEYKDEIFLLPNGYVGYLLSKSQIYIDLDKIHDRISNPPIKAEYERSAETFVMTGNIKVDKKTKGIELYSEKLNCTAYINEKFLKHFKNPTFTGTGYKNVFFVYEKGMLAGVVMPCFVHR